MLILEDLSAEVADTNAYHWNLKDLSASSADTILTYGYNASSNQDFHKQYADFKRKIFFNNWAPCEFAQSKDHNNKTALDYDAFYDEIYSICPYSCEWLNNLNLGRDYKPIFYPFNKKIIPQQQSKIYDVIYHGGIHGIEHLNCLFVMSTFNYRYATMTHSINSQTMQCLPYATNTNLKFQEKINLIAQTKISICYNFVHVLPQHIPIIESQPNWKQNKAFSEVGKWNIMPQFKTRAHEAAISRTLNLVQRDPWNIMEDYYEPEKEFLYFNNEVDLREKIKDIVDNWDSYQEIVENAYKKAMHYTTDKFVDIIKAGKGWSYRNEL